MSIERDVKTKNVTVMETRVETDYLVTSRADAARSAAANAAT